MTIPAQLIDVTAEDWRGGADLEVAADRREDHELVARLGFAEG